MALTLPAKISGRPRPVSPHKQPHHFLHMTLGRLAGQRLAAAAQYPEIRRALEQAEEMLGGVARFIDAQRPALIHLDQQLFHALQHTLRSGLEEDLRQLRVLTAQCHHQPVQVERFIAIDQLMEAARDIQQHRVHRDAVGQFEKQLGQLLFALGDDGSREQRLLVGEMAVDRQLRDTGLGRYGVHAGAGVAVADEEDFRRVEDRLALDQILGTTRTAGC